MANEQLVATPTATMCTVAYINVVETIGEKILNRSEVSRMVAQIAKAHEVLLSYSVGHFRDSVGPLGSRDEVPELTRRAFPTRCVICHTVAQLAARRHHM